MKKHDFMYLVEIDVEYNHNSGTYEKAEVVSVDTEEVLSRVYKTFKIDDKRQILKYCIERIYRLFSPMILLSIQLTYQLDIMVMKSYQLLGKDSMSLLNAWRICVNAIPN